MRLVNCAAPMARDLRPWALCRQLRAREVHHSGGTRETPAPCSTSSALSATRRGASPRRRVFALNASSGEATRPLDEKKAGVQQGLACPGITRESFTKVYKFGGSSVADAERMRQVAKIVCLFENEAPVVVLSAMGKTTNNLIIAGEQAVLCSASEVKELEPLRKIRELHEATLAELEVDQETCDDVMALLDELTMLLVGLSLLKDLTPRSLDSLVSFGERLSTRIFSGYLRRQGVPSVQVSAPTAAKMTASRGFPSAPSLVHCFADDFLLRRRPLCTSARRVRDGHQDDRPVHQRRRAVRGIRRERQGKPAEGLGGLGPEI